MKSGYVTAGGGCTKRQVAKTLFAALLAFVLAFYGLPVASVAYAQGPAGGEQQEQTKGDGDGTPTSVAPQTQQSDTTGGTQAESTTPAGGASQSADATQTEGNTSSPTEGAATTGSQQPATEANGQASSGEQQGTAGEVAGKSTDEVASATSGASGAEGNQQGAADSVAQAQQSENAAVDAKAADQNATSTEAKTTTAARTMQAQADTSADEPASEAGVQAEDNKYQVNGSKTADPVELGDDKKTTVTLSLPSAEYQNKIDIVFVIDDSKSTENSKINFSTNVKSLLENVLELDKNVNLNVGIIKFKGTAVDAIEKARKDNEDILQGLVRYTDSVKDRIMGALDPMNFADYKQLGGSNLHSGLRLADKWLSEDEVAKNENKYVVVLTDCKSYIWNNENDEPTTYYTQWLKWVSKQGVVIQNGGIPECNQTAGTYARVSANAFDKQKSKWYGSDNEFSYDLLFASKDDDLVNTNTEFDEHCYYAEDRNDKPTGTVIEYKVANGSEISTKPGYQKYYEYIPTPGSKWEGLKYFEANPYEVVRNADGTVAKNADGTVTYDLDKINDNFYEYRHDALMKGLYQAGHLWADMNEKYRCGVVAFNGKAGVSGNGGLIVDSFYNWILTHSDYSSTLSNSDDVAKMFNGISNDINYLIGRGTVTDKINNDFDLDMANESGAFQLKVGDDIIKLDKYSESNWYFGEINEKGDYKYVVHYDADEHTIIWDINVPVENAKRASLSYGLVLKDGKPTGWYDTNNFAYLEYTSSDGEYEGTFTFEKPKVHYTESTPTPTPGTDPEPEPTPTPNPDPNPNPDPDPTPRPNPPANTDPDPAPEAPEPAAPAGGGAAAVPAAPAAAVVAPAPAAITGAFGAARGAFADNAGTAIPDDANPLAETIEDDGNPLANLGAWSLFDLLCTILTAILAIVMLVRGIGRKRHSEDDEDAEAEGAPVRTMNAEGDEEEDPESTIYKRRRALRVASVVPAIGAIILFILTQDLTQPMVWFDMWSLVFAIIAIVNIVLLIASRRRKADDDSQDDEQQPAGYAPSAA